jgi:hypothetical protein
MASRCGTVIEQLIVDDWRGKPSWSNLRQWPLILFFGVAEECHENLS